MIAKSTLPSIFIFPEGATANNNCLLRFKSGAFRDFFPVKVMVLKYETNDLFPVYDTIPEMDFFMTSCCNCCVKVTCYEFEGLYDPSHLNLDHNDPEAWKVYSDKVRNIMSKVADLPLRDDLGWKEMTEFGNIYYAAKKEFLKNPNKVPEHKTAPAKKPEKELKTVRGE